MESVVLHGQNYNKKCQFGKRAVTPPNVLGRGGGGCILAAKMRMFAVALSIGAGTMFLVSLDSVVDNLIPVARKYLIEFYGSEKRANFAWGWVVSARSYGIAFGCFCAFLCSDCPSRKWPLVGSFLISFIGGILCMLIKVPEFGIAICCLGRFLSGLGSGLAQVIGSAMLAEIPQIRLRGTCLASLTVWACVGELAGLFMSLDTVLGTDETWHIALGFPVLIIPFTLATLLMAPDSPRALLLLGKENAAFESLKFYQNSEDWIPSLKDVKMELYHNYWPKPNGQNGTSQEVPLLEKGRGIGEFFALRCRFGTGKFVRPLIIGAFVLTLAHLDDWLWISYSTQAFENVGTAPSDAQRASLWMAFPQHLLFRDCHFCAIASGSAYSVAPELFQQSDRIMGTALIGISQNLFGGFLATIALPLMNGSGIEYVLVPFILLNIAYVVVISKKLPETNGKSFYEISEKFSDKMPEFPSLTQYLRAFTRFILIMGRKTVLLFHLIGKIVI
uniref:Major facilitator superfamily (MFS) profile domain-containing protein n=1 Tax=Globodera rostochiensis TaxID=31243 RepID=A0A914HZ91_GLORO